MKILQKPNRFVVLVVLALSATLLYFRPHFASDSFSHSAPFQGTVTQVLSERTPEEADMAYVGATVIQTLLVEIGNSESAKLVEVENGITPVQSGETIFVEALEDGLFVMTEFSRTGGMLLLTVFFVALVLLVSGKKGFNALVGLVFSFAIIFSFIVPQILQGQNPVFISLAGVIFILLVTFYVSHGFSKKSLSALLGIFLTLLLVGVLAETVVHALHFTGFSSDESSFLRQELGEGIDLVALLIAGIIIAAIGVLDDVAITQSSTVFALCSENPSLKGWNLFKKAMTVGKDHVSAVINTLVLAYTGAALPLVLLLSIGSEAQGGYVSSLEIVAEEIVRTLISSSGLVLAVPLTTFIAVFFFRPHQRFAR